MSSGGMTRGLPRQYWAVGESADRDVDGRPAEGAHRKIGHNSLVESGKATMKIIELSTAPRPLAEYVDEIGEEMVVLTDHR